MRLHNGLESVRVNERHDFHFECQGFGMAGHSRVAGVGRFQFEVLHVRIWKRILEVGDEFTDIVKKCRAANRKNRCLVRKFGK